MNMQNFEKVRRTILDPMVRFYQCKPLDQYQIEAFVEDLGGSSEEALDRAWKEVRKACRTRPSIAHFMEALKDAAKPGTAVSNPQDRDEYFCRRNTALANQVMSTPIGQIALREGVGLSLWMRAYRDGTEHFSEADVRKEKAAMLDTARRLAEQTGKPSPFTAALVSMWEAMQERERKLHARYARAA